jgi:hypothetical protein
MTALVNFVARELQRQVEFFDGTDVSRGLYDGVPHRFATRATNFAPGLYPIAHDYFAGDAERSAITWHTHSNHALSSQVCCLNFLMPLARDRDRVAEFISAALNIADVEVEAVETGPDGRDWFIGFEWTGSGNYLGEQIGDRPVQRGSNSTSADAFVRFRHEGKRHGVLIEWKYTEAYGPALPDRRRPDGSGGNETRRARYGAITFVPAGPIKNDQGLQLEDFFWEPFYQLMRQQLLAHQMEKHGEADRVMVLHLSPRGNHKLHRVTAPRLRELGLGDDAFAVFRSLLASPNRFVDRRIEDVFKPLFASRPPDDPWCDYLQSRYQFLLDT